MSVTCLRLKIPFPNGVVMLDSEFLVALSDW